VERQRIERGTGNGVVWHGKPTEGSGTIILSTAGEVVIGRIELGTTVYKVKPVNGGDVHVIYQLDPSKELPLENDYLIPPATPENLNKIPSSKKAVATRGADDGTIVDVLIVYTTGFAAANPGSALDAQINFVVGVANASYTNSGIALRARVVRKEEVAYADGGTLPLDALRAGTGAFSNVPTWRNESGADMVALLRDFKSTSPYCGIAYIMLNLSAAFQSSAYSVTEVGEDYPYYCSDQTFVHELGHNMGSAHNWETNDVGIYSYSRGTEFPVGAPLYHTVMSYKLTGTSRVSHFSNPNVQYNSYATGITNTADNALSISNTKFTVTNWRTTVPIFADVPTSHFAWEWIEGLYRSGITNGCSASPLNYCPDSPVTRAQMAVFLERGIHGADYTPPPCTGALFIDVPCTGGFFDPWIERLFFDGITTGCGGGSYCPTNPVTRAQMAIFLLRTKHGAGYTPPPCTGALFLDVPCTGDIFDPWIEQLANEGITTGCGGGNYCPTNPVTRGQMATFLVRTLNLPY